MSGHMPLVQINSVTLKFNMTVSREFKASSAAIIAAYINPRARKIWPAPSSTAKVRIGAVEVRTGSEEKGHCGSKGDLKWSTRALYHLLYQIHRRALGR
jgi:hypothetical protein